MAHAPLQSSKAYVAEHKPLTAKQARFIRQLRAELGDDEQKVPKTCREGRVLIDSLVRQKRALVERDVAPDTYLTFCSDQQGWNLR